MIHGIDVKSEDGKVVTQLRLTTRAMARLESEQAMPIHKVLAQLETGGSVTLVAGIYAAAMNAGAGGTVEEAFDQIDLVGGTVKAVVFVGEAIKEAFPQAAKEGGEAGDAPGDQDAASGNAGKPRK